MESPNYHTRAQPTKLHFAPFELTKRLLIIVRKYCPYFHVAYHTGLFSSFDPSIGIARQYQHPIQHTFRLYYSLLWIWETE